MTRTLKTQRARDQVVLSLGEWHVTDDPETELVCLGLGSCIAISLYDPAATIGGMAHMVLPDSSLGRPSPGSAKFVDEAIPLLLAEMKALGANVRRLVVDMAGGATMLTSSISGGPEQVGPRNATAVRAVLDKVGLNIRSEETGGSHGRTVRMNVGTGEVAVSTAGSSAARTEVRRAA